MQELPWHGSLRDKILERVASVYASGVDFASVLSLITPVVKKTTILSMPMAKHLLWASLTADPDMIRKALNLIDYHLRRNAAAYRSHRKKKLLKLSLCSDLAL